MTSRAPRGSRRPTDRMTADDLLRLHMREARTVRAPDVAFVRRDRLPDAPPPGYATLAPDLVIEVLSPDDRPGEVLSKIGDWLVAGTALVWVVDPERRSARVYRGDGTEEHLAEADRLSGETVLPGFECELRRIVAQDLTTVDPPE